ncbi:lysozyme-like domain-containing protein [Crassisporium funariophilum]|nr:lysozyme-like domain-containing protein [Crassisporium funariophilum]
MVLALQMEYLEYAFPPRRALLAEEHRKAGSVRATLTTSGVVLKRRAEMGATVDFPVHVPAEILPQDYVPDRPISSAAYQDQAALHLPPAPDPIGLPTVGYGHLCKSTNCAEVPFLFPLTQAQATTLLNTDLKTFTSCISRDVVDSVRLNSNQYGALTSWAFNVGCGNSGSSTLIARLNAGENPNTVAEQELPKWNLAGGQVLPGLVRRRAAEVVLFKTASSVISHPSC